MVALWLSGLTAAVGLLSACADRPATQVMISLATDLRAPAELRQLSMTFERFVEEQRLFVPVEDDLTTAWEIDRPPSGFELPSSIVTFTSKDDAPKIRVTVVARDAGGPMIQRQAIFRLVREKTLYMRMGITSRCLDNADCPAAKTCIEGRCRDPELFRLPEYDAAKRPELSVQCNSGTAFRNTTTGDPLPMISASCAANEICLEGACYPNDVFGSAVATAQPLTISVQVTDVAGAPLTNAEIRTEDGPVTLVRRLRNNKAAAALPPVGVSGGPGGIYQIQTQTDPLTSELRLTVTAPTFAPQVVTVPFKAGVGLYQVPAVLFPLTEVTLMPGENRVLPPLLGGGRTAMLQLPAPSATPVTVRYALTDGRHLPGQGIRSGAAGDLLQSVAVLYLENVGQSEFPLNTKITLGTSSTPPVVGAEGGAAAYVLDLQGQWRPPQKSAFEDVAMPQLTPSEGGFWAIANLTPRPACVRGKVLRPDRTVCTGARVRLLGPEGVSSSDSTGVDGGFCGGAAQQEAAIVAVGSSTRTIYVPAAPSTGAACGLPANCTDIGEVVLENAADCDKPPALVVGRRQPGDTCTTTLDCAGLASCHQGFCVGESYARVSMTWTAKSDFDLHVRKLPGGQLIYEKMRMVQGVGHMDVEQCSVMCTGDRHVENVVLVGDPGAYEVWVQNFSGAAPGDATIDVYVAGKRREVGTNVVSVPGTTDGKSASVMFTLP